MACAIFQARVIQLRHELRVSREGSQAFLRCHALTPLNHVLTFFLGDD